MKLITRIMTRKYWTFSRVLLVAGFGLGTLMSADWVSSLVCAGFLVGILLSDDDPLPLPSAGRWVVVGVILRNGGRNH